MKLDTQTINALADRLENCQLQQQDTTKITDDHPDMDWDDAYAIQDELRRRKVARGLRVIGLKAAYYNEYSAKGGSNPQAKGSTVRFTFVKAF